MSAAPAPVCDVAVVIAAYRAADTIGMAVRSALAESEVVEVIVVDDCSPDNTARKALEADDGSGRLRVLTQPANAGPAEARNRGFAEATAGFIAILDADDYFLPGRFSGLFGSGSDWDVAADNILFVTEGSVEKLPFDSATVGRTRTLGLAEFIDCNISRFGRQRAELGFLKPVFRRKFLQDHALRYESSLRLGEDFALYVRALIAGARFQITSGCGYVAVERPDSLSGRHRTEDLAALRDSDDELLARLAPCSPEYVAVRRHREHIARRHIYRAFLDERRRVGILGAFRSHLGRPSDVLSILRSNALDRLAVFLRRRRAQSETRRAGQLRYLMES